MNSDVKTIPAPPLRCAALTQLRAFATRKIWLPRTLYTLIPLFYLLAGCAALICALYLPGSSWFVPYAILTAGISVHVAALISIARYRAHRDSLQQKYPHSYREDQDH